MKRSDNIVKESCVYISHKTGQLLEWHHGVSDSDTEDYHEISTGINNNTTTTNGMNILAEPIDICTWRAPLDNDRGGGPLSHETRWHAAGYHTISLNDAIGCEIIDCKTIKIPAALSTTSQPTESVCLTLISYIPYKGSLILPNLFIFIFLVTSRHYLDMGLNLLCLMKWLILAVG